MAKKPRDPALEKCWATGQFGLPVDPYEVLNPSVKEMWKRNPRSKWDLDARGPYWNAVWAFRDHLLEKHRISKDQYQNETRLHDFLGTAIENVSRLDMTEEGAVAQARLAIVQVPDSSDLTFSFDPYSSYSPLTTSRCRASWTACRSLRPNLPMESECMTNRGRTQLGVSGLPEA